MKVTLLHLGLAVFLTTPVSALSVQDADESALDALDKTPKPAVVKQEPAGAAELRDAVRRIAQRPTDSFALTDAGYAAVKLGDFDAAFNFFTKANALSPSDPRIKTGLGISQVRRENPFEALSLFDEAVRLGANERTFALDRALAFDLLGNFERAERDYALAASLGPSDELAMRHAISLSLAGKRDDADRMLIPLLQKEDPAAWRTRAMMLASRGDYREAGKIASGFLSDTEARRMDGYFRNMPRLTPAQQAAALHFGHFPVGSNIGEDSNSVRTLAAATGAKPPATGGDSRLIPSGEPLGTKTAEKPDKAAKPSRKDKEVGKRASGVATASAQQAIEEAAKAKVTSVAAAKLPPPEAARPPVRIALPALARAATPPAPAASGNTQTPTVFTPVTTVESRSANAELPAVGPAVGQMPQSVVQTRAEIQPQAQSGPSAADKAPTVIQPSAETDVRIAPASPSPSVAVAPPMDSIKTIAATMKGAEGQQPVAGPPVETQTAVQGPPAEIGAAPGFDSLPMGPVSVAAQQVPESQARPAIEIPATPQPESAQPTMETRQASVEALPVPAAEKPFDLGALVASIDVPEEEKKPSVAPVDLKKIKPVAPKPDAVMPKTDAKTAKSGATGPRIWVQVATGADLNGLGFDYRRMAKRNAALFANRDGWTAVWGKTRRLLVGPFPDMKAAKKWETDFRKAGGDGFVWQSDKSAVIDKLK